MTWVTFTDSLQLPFHSNKPFVILAWTSCCWLMAFFVKCGKQKFFLATFSRTFLVASREFSFLVLHKLLFTKNFIYFSQCHFYFCQSIFWNNKRYFPVQIQFL